MSAKTSVRAVQVSRQDVDHAAHALARAVSLDPRI